MTAVLFDTSAYSALGRGHPAAAEIASSAERIVVTPIVVGELLSGFEGGESRRRNRETLRRFLHSPRVETVPIDGETAERYAVILASLRKAGRPIATHDLWIAASAMQHGLPIVTADADFRHVPQVLVRML